MLLYDCSTHFVRLPNVLCFVMLCFSGLQSVIRGFILPHLIRVRHGTAKTNIGVCRTDKDVNVHTREEVGDTGLLLRGLL